MTVNEYLNVTKTIPEATLINVNGFVESQGDEMYKKFIRANGEKEIISVEIGHGSIYKTIIEFTVKE